MSPGESGQQPATTGDVRKMYRGLTWQNVVAATVVAGVCWAIWRFGVAAVVGDAVAESPRVQQLEQRTAALEKKSERLEDLAIRQLQEQRAIGDWVKTGYRSPVLDMPLPTKDAGP